MSEPVRAPFTYCVLQYAPDASGERLNIGVLVHSQRPPYVGVKFGTPARLTAAFAELDESAYMRVTDDYRRAIAKTNPAQFKTAQDIALREWPDRGLSYQFTDWRAGLSDGTPRGIRRILTTLCDRFVTAQTPAAVLSEV